MVNLSQVEMAQIKNSLLAGLPVLVAAFCYPIGNQMVWEAQKSRKYLPHINSPILDNPFNKVLLLSLGSVPFWLVLLAIQTPPSPSTGQLLNTALVALFSGVFATSLFLFARNRAQKASELAAVDATQSSEVVFALLGEILILGAPLPSGWALTGIAIVFAGLALFIRFQEVGV
jgi:drug/metabolite transporter (DMT)-like permease